MNKGDYSRQIGIKIIATTKMLDGLGKKLVFSSYPRVEGEVAWKITKGLFGGCGNAGEGVGWTAGSGVDNHRDWE